MRGFTILIIAFFTCITLLGVKESSTVTLFLFSVHTLTITILVVWGFIHGCQDGFELFVKNWETPLPNIYSSEGELLSKSNGAASIFFGYSSALLGITGFETASNYVEDLASPAVFVSSVNWMW
jgi:amino acid transporter